MSHNNPNPARISEEMWRFWHEFKAHEPEVLLGGIYANKSGYHNTRDANNPTNYSVREAEDRGGPGDKAAAIDLTFPSAQRGDYRKISLYCNRLMDSGKNRDDPRLDGWREWYGQTDSDAQVEGWDCRHLLPITSDSSHLWHIHMSIDRDKVHHWPTHDAALSVLRGEPLTEWKARNGIDVPLESPPPPPPPPAVPPPPPGLPVHNLGARLLVQGMRGTDVRFAQRFIGPEWCGAADGDFGPNTTSGVKKYQKMRGIGVDGKVGPNTWRAMGVR